MEMPPIVNNLTAIHLQTAMINQTATINHQMITANDVNSMNFAISNLISTNFNGFVFRHR